MIVVPEADLLFGFGYGDALNLLAGSLSAKVAYKLSCVSRGSEIEKFKSEWMKKAHRVDYEAPEGAVKEEAKEEQITHFYGVGDRMSVPISLYLTLKFGLVSPKILVLVDNLREVYRYALLLERCRIPHVGIYNHEDPLNLRFYVLSVWMSGTTGILIATPQLLEELRGDTFRKLCRKKYKRDRFVLLNMAAIIVLGLGSIKGDYNKLIEPFEVKPFLMTFLENNEAEIGNLQELIAFERGKFEHAVIKELPIGRKEIEGFRYRVNDVWMGLTNHRADLYRQLDFKKKLLKTPELKEQFQTNAKEREVLVKAINDLRKKIDHRKVTLSEFVPEYLVPECLKASYGEQVKAELAKQEEKAPLSHQKVKKVLRYVDLEDENPETTDVSRLKLISARKRWKLLHGFKLKKRNRRLEQKGVFES
jgi:ATP-dependent RNA helicase DDX56/DBP9